MISNSRESRLGSASGMGDAQLGVKVKVRDEREGSRLPAMSIMFYVDGQPAAVSISASPMASNSLRR